MAQESRCLTAFLLIVALLLAACQNSTVPLPTLAPLASTPTSSPSIERTVMTTTSATLTATMTTVTVTPTIEPTLMPTAPPTDTPIPTPAGPPDVVLIIVDSVRADHLSSYGYFRPTTPNLDRWITSQGAQFTRAIASAPWTCPSNAAMMSGRTPSSLGSTWDSGGNSLPAETHTLAEYLQQAGYYTAGFISNSCLRASSGFGQGFAHYDDSFTQREKVDSINQVDAAEMNELVLDWLENHWLASQNTGQPLFLFIYYMDPHVLYDPPPPYDTLYDPDYNGPFTPEVFGVGREVLEGTLVPSPRDVEHIQALYDGEITYWDSQFDLLMDTLQEMGMLDNSLVVVTADHGEMFGEHGTWVHGTSLYEGVIRVPLLMRYPAVIPTMRVDMPVQNMDLMPTILNLAGFQAPTGLDAISLLPLFQSGVIPERGIFSEVDQAPSPSHWAAWIAPDTDLRSVEQDGWKLIHHVGAEADDELYDLQEEWPYEVQNLLDIEGAKASQMRQILETWFGR